ARRQFALRLRCSGSSTGRGRGQPRGRGTGVVIVSLPRRAIRARRWREEMDFKLCCVRVFVTDWSGPFTSTPRPSAWLRPTGATRWVFATHRTLVARGVVFTAPPERQPWGGVLAHSRDPDGNVLSLLGAPSAT